MNSLASDILSLLKLAAPHGLSEELILKDLRLMRHRDLTAPQLQAAIRELADQSFVTTLTAPLSGKRWRLTPLGMSEMEVAGL